MKRLKRFLLNWIQDLNLKRMIKEAERLHKMTGKQHFVIPVDNWSRGKFAIVNKESHNLYNRQAKKLGKPQISFLDLCKVAAFRTSVGTLNKR